MYLESLPVDHLQFPDSYRAKVARFWTVDRRFYVSSNGIAMLCAPTASRVASAAYSSDHRKDQQGMHEVREEEDAHGRLMYHFLKGEEVYEVVERDDGYVQAVPASGYFLDYQKWPLRHKRAVKYARGRVLDIGCGAGRHSIYLQWKGLDVLGIDISPYAIRTSK